jgi:endonuclease/exonuclease/phosphatase family metal-dependent hydrolase
LLFASACAPTINLVSPTGPRFEGNYAPAPTGPLDGTPLRIVTFNIKLSEQVDRAIEVLRGDSLRGADILALQEMSDAAVERIARSLGLNYTYFPGNIHPTHQAYFGEAVLSRWPIERSWKVVLPHEGLVRHQRRTATAAIVRVRGRDVLVYAVHLETQVRVSEQARRDQAMTIVNDARGFAGPVVVAGDFNSQTVGGVFARSGFSWPTERVGPTVAFFSWDHIFVRGLGTASSAGVVQRIAGASDHHPVWATLRSEGSVASAPDGR